MKCVLALSLNRREDQRPIPEQGILLDPAAVHIALTGRWVEPGQPPGRERLILDSDRTREDATTPVLGLEHAWFRCLVFSVQSGVFVYSCQVNVKIISFSRQSWSSRWGRCRSPRNILEERTREPCHLSLPNTVKRTWGGQVLMYVFQDSTVGTQQSGDGGAGP